MVWVQSTRGWLVLALPALCFAPVVRASDPATPAGKDSAKIHWSFKKPEKPEPPKVHDAAWVRTPVDAFILDRLEKAGLKPAPPADRLTLLRRVTLDLTGLPPTLEDSDAFLQDDSPDAYARVVDHLLASPRYGERWAQHWLDVVRYADSNGFEMDADRSHAWRYRDYAIRAFNEDKPYDRFVTEQLAGDLQASGQDPRKGADLLVAVGFNRCGPIHLVSGNVNQEENRQEVLTEMTGEVGSAFLGVTMACARCHDHKFDPIPQVDYYRLQAFFASANLKEIDIASAEEKALYAKRKADLQGPVDDLQKKISALEAPHRTRIRDEKKSRLELPYREALAVDPKMRTPEQKKRAEQAETLLQVTWDEVVHALPQAEREARAAWRARLHALEAQSPAPPAEAWTLEEGSAVSTYVLKRGNVKNKGHKVESGFPTILGDLTKSANQAKTAEPGPEKPPDRLDLARWLIHPDHPLTARVMVNRLWQHHFGRGIVATPNEFGVRGQPPTHPELLDWLAREFIDHGWSLKHVHRLMVLSNAYRQASRPVDAKTRKADPENRLLSRMNRRRLEGEALRDCMLAASGELNLAQGGPPVRVPLEPEVADLIFTEGEPDGVWLVTPDPKEHVRRSIYLFVKRNVHLPMLEAFDQPDTLSSCPVRPISTFAPQALILLNGPFAQERAKAFALRLFKEGGAKAEDQIRLAYRLALGRPVRDAELKIVAGFLASQADSLRDLLSNRRPVALPLPLPNDVDPAEAAALTDFCLALLNTNEFLYAE